MTNETTPTLALARAAIEQAFVGQSEVVELALATFLGGGHLLLEGPPGTGKTSLAKALAHQFGLSLSRIQLTSDLLPSDIVGILRLVPGSSEFELRPGPIFAHCVLADELNRSSPKTQSALLEAMAEGTVTIDGKTRNLPDPFFVIATQNPYEYQGVFPLAESQLDRFSALVEVGHPGKEAELSLYQKTGIRATADAPPALSIQAAKAIRDQASGLYASPEVTEYLARIIQATRESRDVIYGASVRAGKQLLALARGLALLRGNAFVSPNEIQALAPSVLGHRLSFADSQPTTAERHEWVRKLLETVPAPR